MTERPAALYRRDPDAYLDAFRVFCDASVIEGDEYELLVWAARATSGAGDDLLPFAGAGIFVARWEEWVSDLAGPAIGLFPGHRENEYRHYAERGIPEEFIDPIYTANVIRAQLDEFAEERTLLDRLEFIFDRFILDLFESREKVNKKAREVARLFFEVGIGVSLAFRRIEQQSDQGIFAEPYTGELVFLQSEPDPLADVDLPAEVRGCVLGRDDVRGYTLRSGGSLGSVNEIKFTAEGGTANIWLIAKKGKVGGRREVKVPEPKLVDALRTLGFEEMIWPNGNRYRLSSFEGLSGIRRVRE